MPYIKCTDETEAGNYIVAENGMIGRWRVLDGQSRLTVPLTQAKVQKLNYGETPTLYGRYEASPNVFLYPNVLTTYYTDGKYLDQEIEITPPTITALGEGLFSAGGQTAKLTQVACTDKFVPLYLSFKDTTYYGVKTPSMVTDKTFGPISVPNVEAATASIFIHYLQANGNSSGYWRFFHSYSTFKVGVSDTSDGTITWGTPTTHTCTDLLPFILAASVSTAGNYLWLNVTCNCLTTYLTNSFIGGPALYNYELYQAIGVTVTCPEATLQTGGTFEGIVVGR